MTLSTPIEIKEVPGLFVCTNFFSHDIENELYYNQYLFPHSIHKLEDDTTSKYAGKKVMNSCDAFTRIASTTSHSNNDGIPLSLVKVCNGIVESGLFPNFIAPNHCFAISYTPNSQFQYHYDSQYRWGETIAAITLGTGGIMSFWPRYKEYKTGSKKPNWRGKKQLNDDGLAIEIRSTTSSGTDNWICDVYLPPRSIYVMSGPSKHFFKHAVKHNNEKNRFQSSSHNPNPLFTSCKIRRTITLRCFKVFSDEVLQRTLHCHQNPQNNSDETIIEQYEQRWKKQSKFYPQDDDNEDVDEMMLVSWRREASMEVNYIHQTFPIVHFNDHERGYVIADGMNKKTCWPLLNLIGAMESTVPLLPHQEPTMMRMRMRMRDDGGDFGENNTGVSHQLDLQQALAASMADMAANQNGRNHNDTFEDDTALAIQLSMQQEQQKQQQQHLQQQRKVTSESSAAAVALTTSTTAVAATTLSPKDEEYDSDDNDRKPPARKKMKQEKKSIVLVDLCDDSDDDGDDGD